MKKDIKKETLRKIKKEEIKIHPKFYFTILKGLTYTTSILLALATIAVVNLALYLPLRTTRMVENAGINEYLSLFPWPLLVVGAAIITLLIYLYKNHEGGYKKHFRLAVIVITLTILGISTVLATSNFNERVEQKPGFKRFYQWNEDNLVPRGPHQRMHRKKFNLNHYYTK